MIYLIIERSQYRVTLLILRQGELAELSTKIAGFSGNVNTSSFFLCTTKIILGCHAPPRYPPGSPGALEIKSPRNSVNIQNFSG